MALVGYVALDDSQIGGRQVERIAADSPESATASVEQAIAADVDFVLIDSHALAQLNGSTTTKPLHEVASRRAIGTLYAREVQSAALEEPPA